jgi:hypothetical protein
VFPEPLDSTSQNDLGQYLYDNGSVEYFGFINSGTYPAGPNYADDLNVYVQYSGWTGGSVSFVSNVSTISSGIRQTAGSGTDSYGCPQNQYTFGTVEISTSEVNPNVQYAYSIWIPLVGVGGSLTNMTINAGLGTACSTGIGNELIPDSVNSTINVTVPSGCVIPAGTYRVLWVPNLLGYPAFGSLPQSSAIFIKGENKS